MSNINYKKLDTTTSIEQALPQIIDAFTTFYGENQREYIEKKFTDLLIIGYGNPNNLSSLLNNIKNELTDRLKKEFMEKNNVPDEEKENFRKTFLSNTSLDFPLILPFYRYVKYKETSKDDERIEQYKKNAVEFLEGIYPDITIDNFDEYEQSGKFIELDRMIPSFKAMLDEYTAELDKISNYIEEEEYNSELKKNIEMKHMIQLIDEFAYLLPASEVEIIKKSIDSGYLSIYSCPVIGCVLGNSLQFPATIEAFSEENDLVISEGVEWKADSVKNDRMKYFKKQGIDLGDDSELYISNPECLKIMPTQELITKIINRKKELHEQAINEYYSSTNEYKINERRIKEKGLVIKDNGFDANTYFNNKTFIGPNVRIVDGEYVLSPIMCVANNIFAENADTFIIHELNHVYEVELIGIQDGVCEYLCGWDYLDQRLDDEREEVQSLSDREKKRDYELFNEIINEIIAQEITTILHESGNYILCDPDNVKVNGGTSYERTMFLVREFYETYKTEIIASRKSGNLEILFEKVGKENFDLLNGLFHEYYEYFSGMKIYNFYEDRKNGRDTELTRKYDELVEKRNGILIDMYEHSKQQQL